MKKILPLLSLFLASCASYHTHHSEGVYEDEGYYASDYDPYYGYGGQSSGYSTDGSGVYFNDYNYYPDRWGINYSSSYYSPYRYPRIGFYYRDCFYWTWGCYGYGGYHSWSSYTPWFYGGVAYSSWFYDDFYWYNRWRHRNYEYQHPRYGGRNSARREAVRLADRTRGNRYKNQQPTRHGIKPNRVSRDRSRYTAPHRKPVRTITPRNKQPRVKQPYSSTSVNNYRGQSSVINHPRNSRQEVNNLPRHDRQDAWVSRRLETSQNHRQESDRTNRFRQNTVNNRNRADEARQKPVPITQFKKPNRIEKPSQASRTYNKPKANKSNKAARSKSKGSSSRGEKSSRSRKK